MFLEILAQRYEPRIGSETHQGGRSEATISQPTRQGKKMKANRYLPRHLRLRSVGVFSFLSPVFVLNTNGNQAARPRIQLERSKQIYLLVSFLQF